MGPPEVNRFPKQNKPRYVPGPGLWGSRNFSALGSMTA
jgi:hypothetical protein